MSYFKNVEVNDKVFGLVFGKGKVTSVWEDSFYSFEVTYDNAQRVPYTIDGVPAWINTDHQTVFYKKDIDLMDLDITSATKKMSPKKIIKLRDKKKLDIKCPSGIWQKLGDCPSYVMENYLENELFHMFRKSE